MYSSAPRPPKQSGGLIRVLIILAALSVLLLALVAALAFRSGSRKQSLHAQASTAPTPQPTAAVLTTAPQTQPTTLPPAAISATEETAPPTEETTVPETTKPTSVGRPSTNPNPAPSTLPSTAAPTEQPTTAPSGDGPFPAEDGHYHGNYYIIPHRRPSCTVPGSVYSICGYCNIGIEVDDPVNYPALGHDFQFDQIVPPTADSRGYTLYQCSRCAATYQTDFTDPLPTEPPARESEPTQTEPSASED